MDVAQLPHIFIDDRGRLFDVAADLLDMRLHRHRTPEKNRAVLLPEKFVDDLGGRGKVILARLGVLGVGLGLGQTQIYLDRLHRDVAPFLTLELSEEIVVYPGRRRVLFVADEQLPVGVARVHVELADVFGRLGEEFEELVVDLHALGLLSATEVVVRDLKTGRPVLGGLAVRKRGDLLFGLGEFAER